MGGGGGVRRWGKREITYQSLHCHHQNDSCIKMGSDESHFTVSLTVWDKVTWQRTQTTTFEEKGGAETDSNRGPSAYQPNALPLRPKRLTTILFNVFFLLSQCHPPPPKSRPFPPAPPFRIVYVRPNKQ